MKKSDNLGSAVIMCGISGSGKTYHALLLTKVGYERLSVDKLVWEKVGSDLSELPQQEKKSLFDECRQEVMTKMADYLQAGRKVVVDATHCRRSVRDNIRKICSEINVKPTFLYCTADEEELWRRLSQRKGEGADDLIVSREELSQYYRGFERPASDETDFLLAESIF